MRIYLGSDHAAYAEKQKLAEHLKTKGVSVVDLGTEENESCHYPAYAMKVAREVAEGRGKGILLCGSGIGVSMVANRFAGVRAALCRSKEEAALSRQHNDSNILCLGARVSSEEQLKEITDSWLSTSFEGGRHSLRISQFNDLGLIINWGLELPQKGLEKILLWFVMIFCVMGALTCKFNPFYYESTLSREDGILEYSTVVALVAGSILCFRRLLSLKDRISPLFKTGLVVLGLLFLFGAGEEMSWGQRVFGFHSPSYFAENNTQGEVNIHNLIISGVRINKVIFGTLLGIFVALYILVLPYAYRRKKAVAKFVDSLGLPVPKAFHILAYLVVVLCAELSGSPKKGEIFEFGGVWIFTMMTFWPYNGHVFSPFYEKS